MSLLDLCLRNKQIIVDFEKPPNQTPHCLKEMVVLENESRQMAATECLLTIPS